MIFTSLASSSHGNAYIVTDGETSLLIEAGISRKQLQKLTGFQLSEIAGCLVSHEHKDHSKCVGDLIKDGMKVYMSQGTAEALETNAVNLIAHGEQFSVGTLDVVPFATFHDCPEPLGFLVKSKVDGDVLAFATDTVNLRYKFPGLNILAIEANFDKYILERSERLPEKTKQRIQNTHMEIDVLCDILRNMDLSQCREIYLLHLSDGMSHEGHFVSKILRAVPRGIKVTACGR